MKIVTNKKDVSISINKKVKKYNPFIIIDDEDLQTFLNAGYTEVSELINLAELKDISNNISKKIDTFNNSIASIEETQQELKQQVETINNNIDVINNYKESINQLLEYIENKATLINEIYTKVYNINLNADKEINTFKSNIDKVIEEETGIMNNKLSDMLNNANTIINNYDEINKNIDNNIKNIKNELSEIISQAKDDINTSVEKCKAWANNPVNIPVEDGLYSAKHYSMKTRGK